RPHRQAGDLAGGMGSGDHPARVRQRLLLAVGALGSGVRGLDPQSRAERLPRARHVAGCLPAARRRGGGAHGARLARPSLARLVLRDRPTAVGPGCQAPVLADRTAAAAAHRLAALRGPGRIRPDHAVGLDAADPAVLQDEGGSPDRRRSRRTHARHLPRPPGAAGAMSPRRYVVSLLASAGFARAYTIAGLAAVFGMFLIERLTSTITLVTIVAMLAVIGVGVLLT